MLQAILVWVGAVLAIGLLSVMALGPVIVEVDWWWFERRHDRRRKAARRAGRSARVEDRGDEAGETPVQLVEAQGVHALPAVVVLAEDARAAQRPEVVAQRRGGDRQAEGAARPVALLGEHADDLPARGIGECLQHLVDVDGRHVRV
jgi:hypothetical protein